MGPLTEKYGYDQEDIDDHARSILRLLEDDLELLPDLMLLSLCKALAIIGTEDELDLACLMLDEMRDDLHEFSEDDFEDWEDGEVDDE